MVVLFAALSIGVAMAGCERRAHTETVSPRPLVSVIHPQRADMVRSIDLPGDLVGFYEAALHAKVTGYLQSITVDKGDWVKAGQVLATIQVPELRSNLQQAAANLQIQKITYERLRKVQQSDPRLVSQQDVDVAFARFQQAKASVGTLQTMVDYTRILAPFDGFVRKRLVNMGETYKEKTPLMSLVAIQALKLQGEVPERFAPQLAVGRLVRVEVEAFPGRTFAGTITRVSPAVDVESRTFTVEASVPNVGGVLKPGFFAKASIVIGMERGVPFVPEEAVITFAGIVKVYAITNGKAEERRVTTGQRRDGWVEIPEGVKVGEAVATSGLSQLATGTAVAVQAGARGAPSPEKPETGNRKK